MHADTAQQLLETVLEQEVQCTEQLLETLATERTALAKRDMATLELTTKEKIECSQSLGKLDAQRSEIVSGLGFTNDLPGLKTCFKTLPRADRLTGLWQKILNNVEACKSDNLVNGGMLESGRQQVEQALGILRGQGGSPSLYTPGGVTSAQLGHRTLGKV